MLRRKIFTHVYVDGGHNKLGEISMFRGKQHPGNCRDHSSTLNKHFNDKPSENKLGVKWKPSLELDSNRHLKGVTDDGVCSSSSC